MSRLVVALFALFCLAGCSVVVVMGRVPDTEPLESKFVMGETTRAEVVEALGDPDGCGKLLFPDDPEPRDLCYFARSEATMKESRFMFYFVFFRGGRYDGYMWFSSLPSGFTDSSAAPR